MKASVPIILLCCAAVLYAKPTITVQGDSVNSHYSLKISDRMGAITVDSDGTVALGPVAISLGGGWTLSSRMQRLGALAPSLAALRMRELSIARENFAAHLLFDGRIGSGLVVSFGPFSAAVISLPPSTQSTYLVRFRDQVAPTLFLVRLAADRQAWGVDWQVRYSSRGATAMSSSAWMQAGPVRVVQRYGPKAGEREGTIGVRLDGRCLSYTLSYATALGPSVLYSGDHQTKRTTYASEAAVAIGSWTVSLGHERVVSFGSTGKRSDRQVFKVGVAAMRWQLSSRWEPGQQASLIYREGSSRLSYAKGALSASFVKQHERWEFTLNVGQDGALSLLWRWVLTTDRASESPR